MKNILTALANPYIYEKLKEEKELKILYKDIQYQDGIFEVLEKKVKIDYLLISDKLIGKKSIYELLQNIIEKNKKIKIIVILKNEEIELKNKLKCLNIKKIYFENEIKINEIIDLLKNKKIFNNNKDEIIDGNLKNVLESNEINLDTNEKICYKNRNLELIKKNKKIISIAGTGGVGKSIVTLNLVDILKEKNNKILIIDFDILNNSLHTILGVNKYNQKIKNKLQKNDLIKNKIDLKKLTIKINKKVDLISGINLIFDKNYKLSYEKIKFILEELQQYYEIIIIDTSSECFYDYTKNILKNSNLILFLLEGNFAEISKANKLLNMYKEEWNIDTDKINIIINKYNKSAINENIIKNIFWEYKILGKIKYSPKYNSLINKNFEAKKQKSKIKKEYEKILNKILKFNNRKNKIFNIFSERRKLLK